MDDSERLEAQQKADRMIRRKVKERQRLEQQMAEVLDLLPGFGFQLYTKFVEEGFNEEQAMALTVSYVEATSMPMI